MFTYTDLIVAVVVSVIGASLVGICGMTVAESFNEAFTITSSL